MNNSLITDIFQGQLFTTVTCGNCLNEHYSFETFLSLSLMLGKDLRHYNVAECLRKFTRDELVNDGQSYLCRTCKKCVDVNKKVSLWRIPPVVVVHLKRFYYSEYQKEKLDGLAEFETGNFDLEEFCGGSSNFYNTNSTRKHRGLGVCVVRDNRPHRVA